MSEPRQIPTTPQQKEGLRYIKSLAMLKMEKNFIALDKGYPRQPYNDPRQPVDFLIKRLDDEFEELKQAFDLKDIKTMKEECADISNIVDYIFEALADASTRDK